MGQVILRAIKQGAVAVAKVVIALILLLIAGMILCAIVLAMFFSEIFR